MLTVNPTLALCAFPSDRLNTLCACSSVYRMVDQPGAGRNLNERPNFLASKLNVALAK
jgi:hypothetical protein